MNHSISIFREIQPIGLRPEFQAKIKLPNKELKEWGKKNQLARDTLIKIWVYLVKKVKYYSKPKLRMKRVDRENKWMNYKEHVYKLVTVINQIADDDMKQKKQWFYVKYVDHDGWVYNGKRDGSKGKGTLKDDQPIYKSDEWSEGFY